MGLAGRTFIGLLVAVGLGVAFVLSLDLAFQIGFKGRLLRLWGEKRVEDPNGAEVKNHPQNNFADFRPAAFRFVGLAHDHNRSPAHQPRKRNRVAPTPRTSGRFPWAVTLVPFTRGGRLRWKPERAMVWREQSLHPRI